MTTTEQTGTRAGRPGARRRLVVGGGVLVVLALVAAGAFATGVGRPAEPVTGDLVRVLATNGREGYVRSDDLQPPELVPANPEEAGALQAARDEASGRAFVASLAEGLGAAVDVEDEIAGRAYDETRRAVYRGSTAAALAVLEDRLGLDPDRLASGDVRALLDEAVLAGERAVQREIPVYDDDRTTRIGVFVVG
ncbi:hypothetical protein [Cellulomonas sp. SLBN-39]|uniref:hypothetical protein n=1 Tax=Cellulomonas sp. SLBN-39 TaxID=2768446 RepID=UPI00115065CF|nr:hypothetical protein [Cellulomonas sp. SLBN-39]TQL02302.1 hypothetical protein FBY24_1376 [Cellulomonas sp. SLBN-39]